MTFRQVLPDIVTRLGRLEAPYDPGSKDKADKQGGEHRKGRSEGYIPEDVEAGVDGLQCEKELVEQVRILPLQLASDRR